MYKLICMSFDGDYQRERPEFETVQAAWEYSNDLGSKWFFYPFHFVVSASGKTVVDAPDILKHFCGMRVATIAKRFAEMSKRDDMAGADIYEFAFAVS